MATDIFEEAPITLVGEITSGHASATSVTFLLREGGAVVRSVGASLDGRRAEAVTPAPAVPDDIDHRAIDYVMLVDGKEYPGGEGFTVWPRDLVVHVTREDGSAFEGFRFKVSHDGAERARRTLPDGSLRIVRTRPAVVTIQPEDPYEVVRWTDELGRLRRAVGRKALKAKIVSPDPGTGEGGAIEQLVNIPGAAEGLDRIGHRVTVTVCVDGDEDLGPGERVGREGDTIFVEASFGRESKRDNPRPTLAGVQGLTLSPDGKSAKGRVRLGPQGEPARFELVLGKAGGDTCTLKVGGTASVGDDKRSFVNWRKIYYQLSRPDTLSLPDLGPPEQGLGRVFVKWEKYHEEVFRESSAPSAPPGTWFDGDIVGLSGRALCIAPDHNLGFFHGLYRDEKRPLGMHLLLSHLLVISGTYGTQIDAVASPELTSASTISFPPTGATGPGWTLDIDPAKDKVRGVFRVSFQDGGIPVRNPRWRCTATAGANVGKTGVIPEDRVDVPTPAGRSYKDRNTLVHFLLPAEALLVLGAGDRVVIEADVVWARGPVRGVAAGGDFLAVREAPAGEMGGTLLHEIGHAMKQAVGSVPPGLKESDHGVHYTERGHQGPHCAFGVDPAAFNAGGKTASLLGRTDAQCVMFGESTDARPVAFCEKCEPFARAEAVESLVDR